MPERSGSSQPLMLSSGSLDRDALRRAEPGLPDALLTDRSTLVLPMHGDRLPVGPDDRLYLRAPVEADESGPWCYLGRLDDLPVIASFRPRLPRPHAGEPPVRHELGYDTAALRDLAPMLDHARLGLAVTATAMANWVATQGFCSRCGAATESIETGWVRRCPQCGLRIFPRTDAAVIMSVIDADDRLLLAQGVRHRVPTGVSVLAGFLEPGESLDAAVRREVLEEVGVRVGSVAYVDNQPWPMPASLMVGFEARAESTELTLDPAEIVHAEWFSRAELGDALASGRVSIPPKVSIARHLIERWYGAEIAPQPGDRPW